MADFDNLYDIQRNMASRLSQEMHMNQTVELLSLMQELVPDKFGRIQKELVIVEAMNRGMAEADVLNLIQELVRQRTIQEKEEYLLL